MFCSVQWKRTRGWLPNHWSAQLTVEFSSVEYPALAELD
jgi:hypothetical protein